MAKTIEQIQEEVQQIKNETVAKQNTATRVGGALEDMVEKMEADSIEVEGKFNNLGSKVGELIGKDSQIINIDLHSSQYEKISYFISSANTWQFGGNCRGYSIPFSQYAGAKLNIQYANL